MNYFILISGTSGVGKDTFAQYLQQKLQDLGYVAIIESNATPVKEFAEEYFDCTNYKTDIGKTIMMGITSLVYENFDKYYFERKLVERAYRYKGHADVVIVPDWRYKNTEEYLKKQSGIDLITMLVKRDYNNQYTSDVQQKEDNLIKELNPKWIVNLDSDTGFDFEYFKFFNNFKNVGGRHGR